MEKFEIGQVVCVKHEEVARRSGIRKLIGESFVVDTLSWSESGFRQYAVHKHYYIPPEACELVVEAKILSFATAINNMRDVCHKASYDAGWWHDKDGNHFKENPYAFSNKLMLIVTELAEACEGDRKGLMDDKLPHRLMTEVELADAMHRLMDLAGAYDLDIGGALVEKMAYNKTRQDHSKEHREAEGGKRY